MLTEAQRQLLGLGAGARIRGPPGAALPAQPVPEPLITPPSKSTRPFVQATGLPEESQGAQLPFTPGSRGSKGGNVTPDQLQRILQEFDDQVNASTAAANSHAPAGQDFVAFGSPAVAVHPSPSNTYR